jgi:acyl-CoA reductase-like NAD-dependent aldehyde dehydrogenase
MAATYGNHIRKYEPKRSAVNRYGQLITLHDYTKRAIDELDRQAERMQLPGLDVEERKRILDRASAIEKARTDEIERNISREKSRRK